MSYFCILSTSLIAPGALLAAGTSAGGTWAAELMRTVRDPWFFFGMAGQGIFFLRFVIQWVISERRGRSTIPVIFWYLSMVGGLTTFVYACHEAQPVFMLGQLLACVIYVRNLMLIHGRSARLRRAGLPGRGRESVCSENEAIED